MEPQTDQKLFNVPPAVAVPAPPKDRYWVHIGLFILTFISCIYAGILLAGRMPFYESTLVLFDFGLFKHEFSVGAFWDGFSYAFAFLLFLTVHEFGHYFAARNHKISTSLPYFIPFFIPNFLNLGTFGAVIRIREPLPSTKRLFDVGAAGPLAGFVIAIGVVFYALFNLPGPEYVFTFEGHDALKDYIQANSAFPAEALSSENGPTLYLGNTILFWIITQFFSNVPPMYEMYHYPILMAGWLGMFFTALNMLPVGQLDGGHVTYALFGGKLHRKIAQIFVMILLFSGGVGFVQDYLPILTESYGKFGPPATWLLITSMMFFFTSKMFGRRLEDFALRLSFLIIAIAGIQFFPEIVKHIAYTGWIFWCLLIVLFIKIDHPPVMINEPLTPRRKLLGYLSLLIFVLCFSIQPLYIA